MKTSEPIIEVTYSFDHSIELIWVVLTQYDHMIKWFFDNIPDFKAEKGFRTRFLVNAGGRSFTHLWEITDVEPLKRITYNWKYEEYDGDSKVHFDLYVNDGKSFVKVTCEVIQDFPEEVPEFSRESCEGGWNYFIGESLPKYLSSLAL